MLAKCTVVFAGPYNDWTEVYYVDTASIGSTANLDAVLDYFKNALLDKRLPLLGKEYGILLIRADFPGTDALAKSRYLYLASNSNQSAGDPNITVVVRCGNANNTRTKTIHMRGIWDSIEIEGGVFKGKQIALWNEYWNEFTAALVGNGWGWYGKLVSTKVRVSTVVVDADGFITFTTAANLFTVPAETQTAVRISKAQGALRLNGSQLVRVVDATHCVTLAPLATFTYTGGAYMRWNTQELIDIANVDASRMGRRDAGKKLAYYRGRQKATPRG